jgi:RHS repeat-associated protein
LNFRTNNALVQTFNVNSLNELTTATKSGTLTVAGTTTMPATNVTVNGLTAALYADNTFDKAGFTVTNGINTFIAAAQDAHGRHDTSTVTVNLPATNSFVYDANGSLTNDGLRGFNYDDENQLTRVTLTNQFKKEFVYDGVSRLRIKREFNWIGSAWTQTNEIHFLYDGNLIIQHRDTNNSPVLTLTRGLDFGGTLQGAGGIGGLLALTINSQLSIPSSAWAHSYFHADGNGNVTCLINTNQLIMAKAEYDPYGNFLSLNGPLAGVNPYWFSSELHDNDLDFYHYPRRVYIPALQRWPNRDPIGEYGGLNLYTYVYNSPLNWSDPLGMQLLELVPRLLLEPPPVTPPAEIVVPRPPVGIPLPRVPDVSYPRGGPFPPEGTVENVNRPGSFGYFRPTPKGWRFKECWRFDKDDPDHFHYWGISDPHMTPPLPPFQWFTVPPLMSPVNAPPASVPVPPGVTVPPGLVPPPPGSSTPIPSWLDIGITSLQSV